MNTVLDTLLRRSIRYRERRFIEAARTIAATPFPSGVLFSARNNMPDGMLDQAMVGLRNFFLAYAHTRFAPRALTRTHLAMPTAGVDALWHAFVLDTRTYAAFCNKAFGGMLHHTPAATHERDSRYDWRARALGAHAMTLAHVEAARSDLAALAPYTHRSFGAVDALFVSTAFVTTEFPYTFTMDELASERAALAAKALTTQRSAGDGGGSGGCGAPTCFGHCGDAPAGGTSGFFGGESGGWGGSVDSEAGGGGDGGGGCSGGCSS
jgi:hypothetical protein